MGLGALLIFIGVALFSSHLVVPLATAIGWPGAKLGGAAGVLARDNSQRNPQRTGSTAAALMIGLALVTLVAMLASGIRSSFFDAVNKLAQGDYAVTAQNNFDPIPVATENPIRATRGRHGRRRRPRSRRAHVRVDAQPDRDRPGRRAAC